MLGTSVRSIASIMSMAVAESVSVAVTKSVSVAVAKSVPMTVAVAIAVTMVDMRRHSVALMVTVAVMPVETVVSDAMMVR